MLLDSLTQDRYSMSNVDLSYLLHRASDFSQWGKGCQVSKQKSSYKKAPELLQFISSFMWNLKYACVWNTIYKSTFIPWLNKSFNEVPYSFSAASIINDTESQQLSLIRERWDIQSHGVAALQGAYQLSTK